MSSHSAAPRIAALALLAALTLSPTEAAHGQDAREYINARSGRLDTQLDPGRE